MSGGPTMARRVGTMLWPCETLSRSSSSVENNDAQCSRESGDLHAEERCRGRDQSGAIRASAPAFNEWEKVRRTIRGCSAHAWVWRARVNRAERRNASGKELRSSYIRPD